MTTYEQARAIALDVLRAEWPADAGELVVDDRGREDADGYLVPYAAREALDGDGDFDVLDPRLVIVDKRTGAVERTTLLAPGVMEWLEAMRPTRRRWRPARR